MQSVGTGDGSSLYMWSNGHANGRNLDGSEVRNWCSRGGREILVENVVEFTHNIMVFCLNGQWTGFTFVAGIVVHYGNFRMDLRTDGLLIVLKSR